LTTTASRAADGRTFAELAKLAVSGKRPGGSLTGDADYRKTAAQRGVQRLHAILFPVNVQFPRCHIGRTFENLRQWDQRRQSEQQPSDYLTQAELREFKAACYTMMKAAESWTREETLRHLAVIADHDDVKLLLAMLRTPHADRVLVMVALGRIGDAAAIPALEKELDGPEARTGERRHREHSGFWGS